MSFFERLEQRCKEVDSILCVGLDPHRQDLETLGDVSAEGAFTFATNLIDQTKLTLRSPAANLPLCFFGDEKQQKKRKQRNATSTVVSESVPLLKGLGSTTTRCLVGRRLPSFISFVAGVPRPLNSKIVIFSIFGAEGI
jgi:hypothetical protein